MATKSESPVFFARPEQLRAWLEKNHDRANEIWIGFYRKVSGRQSITWPESVDEALCFGWIDGIRKKVDDVSYKIRFTPRRAKSTWSAVNNRRIETLKREGRVHPAGEAAFARREATNRYSFENRETTKLTAEQKRKFRRDTAAWKFFQAQPAGYRRMATWYVISAKQEETRQRRLERLISISRSGKRLLG